MPDSRKIRAETRNPKNLPTKVCAACARPFTWRKKWERDWENVRYCSDACRRQGAGNGQATDP
jgi:hypothetical protein